jgi:hypothetical protein
MSSVKISGLQSFFARTIEHDHVARHRQQISERFAYARVIIDNDDYASIRLSTQILRSAHNLMIAMEQPDDYYNNI